MEQPSGNIASLFFEQAEKLPKRTALAEKTGGMSFEKLAFQAKVYAGFLNRKGVGKGDRVLVFVPISGELYKVVLAIIQIGAVAVFLDPWSSYNRLKQSAKAADCKALVAGRKLRWLSYVLPVFREIPLKLSPKGKEKSEMVGLEKMQASDTALITFTTGSSGAPKGANRTHGFLFSQLEALRKEIGPAEDDVCLSNLPVFTLSHLAEGITSVIPDYNPRKPGKMKAEKIIFQMKEHQVKTLVCSPDFLLRISKTDASKQLPKLQRIFTGGAPVFPDQAEVIRSAFPDVKITVAYGSTEAEPISSIPLDELLSDKELKEGGLPVGRLHPDAEVQVIRWKDEVLQPSEVELENSLRPVGEIGEIIVSGTHVLKKYYKNAFAQKRQKFRVCGKLWHRTGDSGFFNEEGKLYLTGPCRQLIASEEGFESPFLMEYRLRQLPSIEEGTLIQTSNGLGLFLVKTENSGKAQVKAEVSALGLKYDFIKYLKRLPKDPRHNSKIDYAKLRYSS